jgi:hypothetical protein
MKLLLYSGILYLLGIGGLLFIKPEFMFREDGSWKEFGVGRDPENFTWMPVWLFIFLWAILSYMFILLLAASNLLPGVTVIEEGSYEPTPRKRKAAARDLEDVPPGYYILNMDKTKGAPKYIYLGAAVPNLVYNAGNNTMNE